MHLSCMKSSKFANVSRANVQNSEIKYFTYTLCGRRHVLKKKKKTILKLLLGLLIHIKLRLNIISSGFMFHDPSWNLVTVKVSSSG